MLHTFITRLCPLILLGCLFTCSTTTVQAQEMFRSSSETEGLAESFAGHYRIKRWRANRGGCDVADARDKPFAAALVRLRWFNPKRGRVPFGPQRELQVLACKNLHECDAVTWNSTFDRLARFALAVNLAEQRELLSIAVDGRLVGRPVALRAGTLNDDQTRCLGAGFTTPTLVRVNDDEVRLELRRLDANVRPGRECQGQAALCCSFDTVRRLARRKVACNRIEIIELIKVPHASLRPQTPPAP